MKWRDEMGVRTLREAAAAAIARRITSAGRWFRTDYSVRA
jgi:hypothetical protein